MTFIAKPEFEYAVSFCGIMPQEKLSFGFAGKVVTGEYFGFNGKITADSFSVSFPVPEFTRTLSVSVKSVIYRCTYRIRQVSESFCCTVCVLFRRVTEKVRQVYNKWDHRYILRAFEHISRAVLGWRL